ncbi:xanthine dehydrogenase molybdopterin binding subunit [Pseudanabaena sp. FACHB-1277]|uniref:Xanthine dehydrogenase molybdopterin binding subunit n=1 Tax=Pseudanabaena cinerea FACHB-1277 TaxID=2949581 RepID=A0A926UXK2_9CYAN|nr:xanthine dehydrogenase molybdopterin binding subunit [Pseudanabaena cinerea]MBD2151900.1 xanthine dehydrogenase molybdopterin binding subunit [Pseudanabaena cinerea FACHB-1277]
MITQSQSQKTHESAIAHVSGKAVYTDDQRLPAGMLSLYPVLSPHARAKITKIDCSAAYAVEGLVTILTAADVPGENDTGAIIHDEVMLPTDEVSYWGQVVVWAVGESEDAAREAAAKVVVEYEPLPAILSIEAAIAAQSFHLDKKVIKRGEPEIALEKSDRTITGELTVGGQDHFYLETHTSWVIPDGEGGYKVYSSTQHPSETQIIVARVLGLPNNCVVVTCLRMGGAFGGKESQANPFAAAAAVAAYKTGRPARVSLRRHHDMIITGKRHNFLGRYQVGFTNEGMLTALKVELYAEGGWSLDLTPPVLMRAMMHIDNAYYVPHLEVQGWMAKTNRISNTAYRGFGGPQGMVICEEIIDRIARTLGLAPEVVREQNFYHGSGETSTTHYGQEIFQNRIARVWNEVKANANFSDRQIEIAQFNQTSPYKKRGIAITPVKFGISFNKIEYNQAGALVLIYTDGSIQVNHGGTEMGQGLHTKMLQVAAQSLGVNIDRFRIMHTSTDKVPNTSATAASSGSDLNGQAIRDACETLRQRLATVAVKMLNLNAPEDLVFENDWIYCPSYPSARIGFDEVVKQTYTQRISLSANGFYRTPNLYWDAKINRGRPFYYFAYGAAVSEVEVDGFTGTFKLRQVDIVHDVGSSINPLLDKGQIEGAFVQGMGWLTMEELVWNEQGRLLTFAPSTYKIPTVSEIPEQFTIALLERAAQDGVILGSKAVGEPPFMLAISVREALREAVAAFGSGKHPVNLAVPATPEAILWAIESVRATAISAVTA